jgi:hypothetical protein
MVHVKIITEVIMMAMTKAECELPDFLTRYGQI